MVDYTDTDEIIRGSIWPPAGDVMTLELTKSTGWAGAGAWTWTLMISRHMDGGTADLELVATGASIAGDVLTLLFTATSAQTAALPLVGVYSVGLKSDNGAIMSYYDAAQGIASVRDFVGED